MTEINDDLISICSTCCRTWDQYYETEDNKYICSTCDKEFESK